MPGNTRVREVMTKQVVTIGPDAPVNEAADILAERRVDALPVVDAQGRLLGMLRDDDLISTEARVHVPGFINFLGLAMPWPGEMRELEDEIKKIASSNVRDLMDTDVHPVSPDATLEDVATIMHERKVNTVAVVDGDRVVGIVARGDLVRDIARST